MLIDNNHTDLKVHEWISKYTNLGTFDIVTGYFTIGAISYLSKVINEKITNYRLILGDIVNTDQQEIRTIDLLNETVTVDSALKLNKIAREAVTFLEQNKVSCKTLEPNFCHAKLFINTNKENDVQKKYFITGSSNLTDAGMGLNLTSNVELNIAGFGSEAQFGELCTWFEKLWENPKAYTKKTIIDHDGKTHKIDFKQYLIDEISKVFKEYYPKDIYYKILYELFGNVLISDLEKDPEFQRKLGNLESSVVYQRLYEFQQKGVLSLILMLKKYDGAILADAVGLGKTWTALGVMKYYQSQGYKSVLLCPKKLHQNWRKFLEPNNIFEKDGLDYKI